MFYALARGFLRILYAVLFRVKVSGLEHIPKEGGAVVCSNHISNFDPVSLGIYLPRPLHFMGKRELFQNKFFAWLFRKLKAFPVSRGEADMEAFKTAIAILKSGGMLGIFAQGTRVREEEQKAAKAGVALFALKGGTPVVPAAIVGEYKPFSKIYIAYGAPMYLDGYNPKRVRTEELQEITENIMSQIEILKRQVKETWK